MTRNRGYEKSAPLYELFDTKHNVEFFHHYAAEAGEVLDIGAGTGRIAFPLAERGIRVLCVEPSPAMRREFRKKLARRLELRSQIVLVAADARSFALKRTFPAAFLSGSFDHFLDDEERLASLRNIARHLQNRGTLVFNVFFGLMRDIPMAPAGVVAEGSREYRRFTQNRLLSRNRAETTLVFEIYESDRLVQRFEERSLVGITDRPQIHRLLRETGFEVRREFSDYEFTEYHDGDDLLVVEAVKFDQP